MGRVNDDSPAGNKNTDRFTARRISMLLDPKRCEENMETATRKVGANIGFERTRRITGYLVGTLDRFNDAKRAEERDRARHSV